MPSSPRRVPRRPGPPPQTSKRDLYLQLMTQMMSNSEACRIVGINRRTGTRWRHGRTVNGPNGATYDYPPIVPVAQPSDIPSRYLTEADRVVIADGIRAGVTITAIAAQIGRSPSTVSRELGRNRDPVTGVYTPSAAHHKAAGRRPRPKQRKLATNERLREEVHKMLQQRCSPEQISNRLTLDFPDDTEMRIAPETIYQALYNPATSGIRRDLVPRLRTGRTCRRPRRRPDARHGRYRAPMTMIDQRPAQADDRRTAGHWEGDLITGASNRSAIGTLVERTTRYTVLVHTGGRVRAQDFAGSLVTTFHDLPKELKRSLTWDQGVELACHDQFQDRAGVPVFFCEPHSPWQRPTNENTNGLLRQYFPKGTDLSIHSPDHLADVAAELNNRPRKILGWHTPAEQLTTLLQHLVVATTP